LFAIFYGTPYISGVIFQPLIHMVFARWGFSTSFTLIAIAVIASVAVFPFYPKFGSNEIEGDREIIPSGKLSLGLLILLLFALLLQYVANSGLWLFFQRIGTLSGHDEQATANIVGLGTGMALFGTALAALLARRLSALHGVVLGTGVIILSSSTLHLSDSLPIFAVSVWVFNIAITFVTPFYFILLVKTFRPAKAVILGNICLMLGFSLGPLLIGYAVVDSNFSTSINVTIGLFVISIVLVLIYGALVARGRQSRSNFARVAEDGRWFP
jgi:hypothetical protein